MVDKEERRYALVSRQKNSDRPWIIFALGRTKEEADKTYQDALVNIGDISEIEIVDITDCNIDVEYFIHYKYNYNGGREKEYTYEDFKSEKVFDWILNDYESDKDKNFLDDMGDEKIEREVTVKKINFNSSLMFPLKSCRVEDNKLISCWYTSYKTIYGERVCTNYCIPTMVYEELDNIETIEISIREFNNLVFDNQLKYQDLDDKYETTHDNKKYIAMKE